MVLREGEAFRDFFLSAGHCYVSLGCLSYPSWFSRGFDLVACTHAGVQKFSLHQLVYPSLIFI